MLFNIGKIKVEAMVSLKAGTEVGQAESSK
jgi:hypothetical protein